MYYLFINGSAVKDDNDFFVRLTRENAEYFAMVEENTTGARCYIVPVSKGE
jgi:hypothetical protein